MPAEQSNERVKRLSVELTDDEQAALRHEFAEPFGHEIRIGLLTKLRAALDSPPVEERHEFEVLGRERHGPIERLSLWHDEADAVEDRDALVRGGFYTDLSIRTRTVTETPWTDLLSEEGGDDV